MMMQPRIAPLPAPAGRFRPVSAAYQRVQARQHSLNLR
jgi:hypothetical protein